MKMKFKKKDMSMCLTQSKLAVTVICNSHKKKKKADRMGQLEKSVKRKV